MIDSLVDAILVWNVSGRFHIGSMFEVILYFLMAFLTLFPILLTHRKLADRSIREERQLMNSGGLD
ncbi:MAG: hypothetical protein HQL76_01670 [Magnetococcales bacterium]|nr:hypothetical protein [Magnetococcales bacterium]